MKGMMFTEFLDMVEAQHGLAMKDRIIANSDLPGGGVYTSVGNYDHRELLRMVDQLSLETATPQRQLMISFADIIFLEFLRRYRPLIESANSCFDFLWRVESYIHVEVRKLNRDVEFPTFGYPESTDQKMVMEYRSVRPMAALAEGLIHASIRHYREAITVEVEDLSEGRGTAARFTLTRTDV